MGKKEKEVYIYCYTWLYHCMYSFVQLGLNWKEKDSSYLVNLRLFDEEIEKRRRRGKYITGQIHCPLCNVGNRKEIRE